MAFRFKLSCVALMLASASTQALTLDYRYEYKAGNEISSQRLKLAHTAPNGFFASVEGKVAEGSDNTDDGFKDGNGNYSGSGSEWEMGKNFVVNDKLTLAPAVNIDAADAFIGYRVQLKALYKLGDGWITNLRWRGSIQKDEKPDVADKNYNQFNWEFGYRGPDFSIVGDLERRITNYDDYQGDHGYWLYNLSASMPINKNWTPYTEIGYVPRYNKVDEFDDMEIRYRLGIRYNF